MSDELEKAHEALSGLLVLAKERGDEILKLEIEIRKLKKAFGLSLRCVKQAYRAGQERMQLRIAKFLRRYDHVDAIGREAIEAIETFSIEGAKDITE